MHGGSEVCAAAKRCPSWGKYPVRTLGKGVSGAGHSAERKRQDAVQTFLFPIGSLSAMETPQALRASSPKRGAKGVV